MVGWSRSLTAPDPDRIDRSNYPGGPSMCSRLEIGALEARRTGGTPRQAS